MSKESRTSIDEYLETVPEESRAALAGLRELIRASAPGAEETISYKVPTFKYEGPWSALPPSKAT